VRASDLIKEELERISLGFDMVAAQEQVAKLRVQALHTIHAMLPYYQLVH